MAPTQVVAARETSYWCRQTVDIFDLQSYIVREGNDLLEFKAEHMQLCGTVLLAFNNQRAGASHIAPTRTGESVFCLLTLRSLAWVASETGRAFRLRSRCAHAARPGLGLTIARRRRRAQNVALGEGGQSAGRDRARIHLRVLLLVVLLLLLVMHLMHLLHTVLILLFLMLLLMLLLVLLFVVLLLLVCLRVLLPPLLPLLLVIILVLFVLVLFVIGFLILLVFICPSAPPRVCLS